MKNYLVLLACSLLLLACKKTQSVTEPDTISSEQKVYPVNFNVSGFTQHNGPIETTSLKQTKATYPASVMSKMMYIVFDHAGKQVSRLEQNLYEPNKLYRISGTTRKLISSSSPFGTLSDSLALGHYTLVVTCGTAYNSLNVPQEMTGGSGYKDIYTVEPLSNAKYYLAPHLIYEDCFYYKGDLEVSINNTPKPVTLTRVVGQLTFNIEDAMPANVDQLIFEIKGDNAYYNISNNTATGAQDEGTRGYSITPDEIGKTNYNLSWMVFNTKTPLEITVYAMDNKYKVLTSKTITNVRVNLNQKTTVTGKLFTTNQSGFEVVTNQAWGNNPVIVKF